MSSRANGVGEVWRTFLRLGLTAFGGPAAHMSAMEDEFVRKRGWLTRLGFADLLSASQLLPGPSSTELAMLIGHRRASWGGLMVAGAAFIVPSVLIVWGLAWVYVRFGGVGPVAAVMGGARPVVCAVLGVAVWRVAQGQPRSLEAASVVALSVLLRLAGVHELVVLLCAGLCTLACRRSAGRGERAVCGVLAIVVLVAFGARDLAQGGAWWSSAWSSSAWRSADASRAVRDAGAAPAVAEIGWSFARIGSTVFGSGYVLVAYLRSAFVDGRGWLTESQLLDAIAVGQVTPGPVFATATFVGYLLAGHAGALAATLGIFLPAFFFAAIAGIVVPRLRASPRASAALDGLNAGSLALLCAVLLATVRDSLHSPLSIAIAVVALTLLLLGRISALWVLLGGALVGVLTPFAGAFGVMLLRALPF